MTPERRYRESVNKLLLPEIYTQAMGGTLTNGTPDSYYEWHNILWVEWKWTPAQNPRLLPDSKSWALQKRWLRRAYDNGHQVAVICGSPNRAYVFTQLRWEMRRIEDATFAFGTKSQLARWIEEKVFNQRSRK